MEKEIKKINTYIEMLEVVQQHFITIGDTKNAEFCTIKINSAKEDIAALQAGYEVDMTVYNSLVSDVEEDVIENIEEPVYDEVNPKYEIITLEEANKKTTKKGKIIIASIGCVALTALIVAGILNMSSCHKNNTNEDNTIEPQTTNEEINEVAKVEETEYVDLPVFEEVDLDALIYEASQNIDVGDADISYEELVRYLEIINYDVHENEMDVEYQEVKEMLNTLRNVVINKALTKTNDLNGVNGTHGTVTSDLVISNFILNNDEAKNSMIYLESLYSDMLSDDEETVKKAYINFIIAYNEVACEFDGYSVDNLSFDGEDVTIEHSIRFSKMNSIEKALVLTQIQGMESLASNINNVYFNNDTLDRTVTIENQESVRNISINQLKEIINTPYCDENGNELHATDDEILNAYSTNILGTIYEVNNSKKEAIYSK